MFLKYTLFVIWILFLIYTNWILSNNGENTLRSPKGIFFAIWALLMILASIFALVIGFTNYMQDNMVSAVTLLILGVTGIVTLVYGSKKWKNK